MTKPNTSKMKDTKKAALRLKVKSQIKGGGFWCAPNHNVLLASASVI